MNATNPGSFIGGKLPQHSLWQQLESAGCTLEFCSQFFNDQLSYPQARKWLLEHGIAISIKTLSGFFNSLEMRMRYALKESEKSAAQMKEELPADLEERTRQRIAQHKFELSFMNLSESQRLQLIQIQQNEDAMKGNFALKQGKLDLDRIKTQRVVIQHFMDWYDDQAAKQILTSNASHEEKTEKLGQRLFGDLWK